MEILPFWQEQVFLHGQTRITHPYCLSGFSPTNKGRPTDQSRRIIGDQARQHSRSPELNWSFPRRRESSFRPGSGSPPARGWRLNWSV